MALLQMLHQYSDDHVDQNKLSHKHKDHEEDWRHEWIKAAVLEAVVVVRTFVSDGILLSAILQASNEIKLK